MQYKWVKSYENKGVAPKYAFFHYFLSIEASFIFSILSQVISSDYGCKVEAVWASCPYLCIRCDNAELENVLYSFLWPRIKKSDSFGTLFFHYILEDD